MLLKLFGRERKPAAPARRPLMERPEELRYIASPTHSTLVGGTQTSSGQTVNEWSAMQNTAVYACVRVLSESIASLPLHVYTRQSDGDREIDEGHPYYSLLHEAPNPRMSSFAWRERVVCDVSLWGTHFSYAQRKGGKIVALWPLRPDRLSGFIDGDRLYFKVWSDSDEFDGVPKIIDDDELVRVPGLSSNGVTGIPPIRLLRDAIGAAKAADDSAARYFRNGIRASGALSHPGQLSESARENLRTSTESFHTAENAHRFLILEEGMDFKSMSMTPEDSQLLETRRFAVNDIARAFRVPPHLIGDLERATFSNIEQQQLSFLNLTLAPLMTRVESELNRKVLGLDTDSFAKHDVKGFLRGEFRALIESMKLAIEGGFVTRNEARRELDLPAAEGLDEFVLPLNLGTAGEDDDSGDGAADDVPAEEPAAEPVEDEDGDDEARSWERQRRRIGLIEETRSVRQTLRRSVLAAIEQAARAIIVREVERLRRAMRSLEAHGDLSTFWGDVDRLYGLPANKRGPDGPSGLHGYFEDRLAPLIAVVAAQVIAAIGRERGAPVVGIDPDDWAKGYAERAAAEHVRISRGKLSKAQAKSGGGVLALIATLDTLLRGWTDNRPRQLAQQHAIESDGAVSRAAYKASGVTMFRWIAIGSETCPLCAELDGRIVGVESNFVAAGGEVGNLKVDRDVLHPPLHQGCECIVVPEN